MLETLVVTYQLAFLTPGSSPLSASSRKQTRHRPNLRYTECGRPQRWQRVYSRVENFCLRLHLTIIDVLATYILLTLSIVRPKRRPLVGTALIGQVNLFLERETEGVQKGLGLLIGVGGGHESDVHTTLVIDGVEVDLGEDELLGDAHGEVTTAVEALG